MLHQVGPCNLSLRITRRIVARLSLQILEILKQCNVSKDIQDKVGDLHMNSLLKILLRCWEIEPYRLSLLCAELLRDFGSSFNLFDPASLFQQPGMLRAVSARVALPISAENAYNSRRFGGIWGVRLRPSRAPRVSGRTPTCKFLPEPVSALSRWSLWFEHFIRGLCRQRHCPHFGGEGRLVHRRERRMGHADLSRTAIPVVGRRRRRWPRLRSVADDLGWQGHQHSQAVGRRRSLCRGRGRRRGGDWRTVDPTCQRQGRRLAIRRPTNRLDFKSRTERAF